MSSFKVMDKNNRIFKKMYYSDSFVKYIIGVKEIKHNTCKYNNLTKQVCDWINDVTKCLRKMRCLQPRGSSHKDSPRF